MKKQHGFTLIEILIALGITAIISLIIASTFSTVFVTGLRSNATVDLQTDSRNAIGLMDTDISAAGFLLGGVSGETCHRILTYNSAAAPNQYADISPVSDITQTDAGTVPGTNIAFGYAGASGAVTDAISVSFDNTSGGQSSADTPQMTIEKSTHGTLNSASLFVNSSQNAKAGDIDLVVMPTRGVCIRMQITDVGGANNLVHNSGQSPLNAPGGLSGITDSSTPPLVPSLGVNDLVGAYIQDIGPVNGMSGQVQVTYSIRPYITSPTGLALYRTVVNSLGQVVDGPIAQNAVLLRTLYAALDPVTGKAGALVPWSTIVANNEQDRVGLVQMGLLMAKKNYGNRHDTPATIQVLDQNYTTVPGFEYQLFTRTIYLPNMKEGTL